MSSEEKKSPATNDGWKKDLKARLEENFGKAILREGGGPIGELCFYVAASSIVPICQFLKDREQFDLFVDETAVDYYLKKKPRFELIYNLYSISLRRRVFLKIETGTDDEIPSIVTVYPGANWFEREVWDMFGIRFSGHPNLKRILLYEEFKGHPLRKEYDARHRQPLVGPKS